MPNWNSDLEAFVDYGRTIAYLDSASYVQGSAATNTDVRAGTPVTVTIQLNNPKALTLAYTISVDSSLVDGTVEAPASTTGAADGVTTVSFQFTPTEAAEHGDVTFTLGLSAPSINRTFDPATFKVRCDSPPGSVNSLTAGIRTDGRACIGFTLPEDYANADIANVEITYTSSTAGTSRTVTEAVSPTGTGLTTVPSPSPLSSSAGKYMRYFLPDDVIAGNQYTFTVTPIDAGGKKCDTPTSARLKGSEIYLGYDANGGTGSVAAATYGYNQTTTVAIAAGTSLSRDGYGFTGWNTKVNGTGTTYNPGASYTFGTSSLMLYAQWQKLSNVSVTITTPGYQGVTITQNGTTYTAITMDKDGTINLSMSIPSGATKYQWYLDNTPEATTSAWSFYPLAYSLTSGTHAITATAEYGGVSYSSRLVVTVTSTNNYMITMIPYNQSVTYTQTTWCYVDDSTLPSAFDHTLSRPFSMAKYELSYRLWSAVYSWAMAHGYTIANAGADGYPAGTDTAMPVTTISYYDAIVWCNAYSEMSGFTPCYYSDQAHTAVIRSTTALSSMVSSSAQYTSGYVLWTANGYRLPTEGEWHYAASCNNYYAYNHVSGNLSTVCSALDPATWSLWANAQSDVTVPVTNLSPNIWGLYNMSGNVWEYCFDLCKDALTTAQTNYVCDTPSDPNAICTIVCGGSFRTAHPTSKTTVGHRDGNAIGSAAFDNGFRLARTITQ